MQVLQLSAARTPCLAAGRCPGQAPAAAVSMPCRGMAATFGPRSHRWSFAAPLVPKGYTSARDSPVLTFGSQCFAPATHGTGCQHPLSTVWGVQHAARFVSDSYRAPRPRSCALYAHLSCHRSAAHRSSTPPRGVCRSQLLLSKRPRVASRARAAAARADEGAPHQC